MKILLSLIICSAVAGECKPPFTSKTMYEDWSACMYGGYNDSLQLLGLMGDDYINVNQIFIKFNCKKVEEKQT